VVLYDNNNVAQWSTQTNDNTLTRPINVANGGPVVDTSHSYSISAWVKLNQDTGADQAPICMQGDSRPPVSLVYKESDKSWGVSATASDDSNTGWQRASTGWEGQLNTWEHVAATYSADTHVLDFYFNGYLASSTSLTTPWGANRALTLGGCFFNNDHSTVVDPFNGQLSDVRAYPYTLTNEQVSALYNVPRQTVTVSPVSGTTKCMDDSAYGQNDGNAIQIWDCDGSIAQGFSFADDGAIHVLGKCVDSGGSPASGSKIQLWGCNGTAAQKFTRNPNGTLQLTSNTQLCLDDTSYATANGTQLQLYTCNGSTAQNWKIN
jgi:hypothetical protein